MNCGQIFYGRGKDGYGILGASPTGRPFVDDMASLCRAVGSPDRPSDVRPFLLSKRIRGNVLMIRACRGADPSGRATLFFHAFVAPEAELAAANLDAFVLADRHTFSSTRPDSINDMPVQRLDKPPSARGDATERQGGGQFPDQNLRCPAFVAADHPLNAEVRHALGRETLSRSWATYSYNPLQGFDLCVHSDYGATPTAGNRYVFDGSGFVPRSSTPPPNPVSMVAPGPRDNKTSRVLRASLVANILLVTLSFLLFLRVRAISEQLTRSANVDPVSCPDQPETRQDASSETKQPSASKMTEEEAKSEWGQKWKNSWRTEMRKSLDERLRKGDFSSFKDFASATNNVQAFMDANAFPEAEPSKQLFKFYRLCEAIVDFLETETTIQNTEGPQK